MSSFGFNYNIFVARKINLLKVVYITLEVGRDWKLHLRLVVIGKLLCVRTPK